MNAPGNAARLNTALNGGLLTLPPAVAARGQLEEVENGNP